MKKSKYTEEQITFALRQAETGTPVGKCAARWEYRRPPFTTEKRNTEV